MEKIAHKLKTQVYETVDEIASDFMLMFENACKYNEPDSQLYKDALVLQQICIQTKQSLRWIFERYNSSTVWLSIQFLQRRWRNGTWRASSGTRIADVAVHIILQSSGRRGTMFFRFLSRTTRTRWNRHRKVSSLVFRMQIRWRRRRSKNKKLILWISSECVPSHWIYWNGDSTRDCTNDWTHFRKMFSPAWIVPVDCPERIRKYSKIQSNCNRFSYGNEMRLVLTHSQLISS